jgi:hypothetical protein
MTRRKISVIVMGIVALGIAVVPATNAGTEVIAPYSAPAPSYNYAPPPRPIYYAPPPPVNVLIFPAYGYYGPRFGVSRFYGPRFHSRSHYWR